MSDYSAEMHWLRGRMLNSATRRRTITACRSLTILRAIRAQPNYRPSPRELNRALELPIADEAEWPIDDPKDPEQERLIRRVIDGYGQEKWAGLRHGAPTP